VHDARQDPRDKRQFGAKQILDTNIFVEGGNVAHRAPSVNAALILQPSPPSRRPTTMHALRFAVIIAASVVTARTVRAQPTPTVRLGQPDAEFATPFTQISSIRELSDGRVLIADAQDKTIRLINFATGASAAVGRQGEGPGEYAIPRRLYAMHGDTTLLADPGNGRYMVILPSGKPGDTFTVPDLPDYSLTVKGIDASGRFYYQAQRRTAAGSFAQGAAAEQVIRRTRPGGRIDTLTTVAVAAGREEGAMTVGNGLVRRLTNRPLAAEDAVAVAADGRVAIVRVRDYHLEWFDATRARTVGPAVSYEPIRVTSAEKRAFMDAQVVPGQITVNTAGGDRSMPMPRPPGATASPPRGGPPIPEPFAEENIPWPAQKPPFLATGASIANDGRLWVLRTTAFDDVVPRYDVFDDSGRLTMRVELAKRTRLVGFGRGVVYVARLDDDDVQHLQRYRL
jgi:hypothetical protein